MLFLDWLSWTELVGLDFHTFSPHDEVTPFVAEKSLKNTIAMCAKGRCFWLSHQSFLFISPRLHRMPPFPLGNSWENLPTFRFQLPGLWGKLPDIMYFGFLKACDKVCCKTLLQKLSSHIWWQGKYHHRSKTDKEPKRQRAKWSVFITVKG